LHPSKTLPELRINDERLVADFKELQFIGGTENGGSSRVALSPEDLTARDWFANRIEDAGLELRDDDAGNLSGVYLSQQPHARTLLVGSHLDSVPNGGHYDGVIGVLSALECVRTLREAQVDLPLHVEAINFTDDEGNYQPMFGCRALSGLISPAALSDLEMDNGPFRAAMLRAGMMPSRAHYARRRPQDLAGYLEVHIEQGVRLERAGKPIGVVQGIVGRTNYEFTFIGEAGHSGTTDMYKRRDAMRGAALFIVRAHDLVREKYGDGVFNCGAVEVYPGGFNVIPREARLAIEVRHINEMLLNEMETAIISLARECATSFRLEVMPRLLTHYTAAAMHPQATTAFRAACELLGVKTLDLYSYSGHSAQFLSTITPCGMVFIPSVGGVSHNHNEFSRWEDVVTGANVLLQAILHYALPEESEALKNAPSSHQNSL